MFLNSPKDTLAPSSLACGFSTVFTGKADRQQQQQQQHKNHTAVLAQVIVIGVKNKTNKQKKPHQNVTETAVYAWKLGMQMKLNYWWW